MGKVDNIRQIILLLFIFSLTFEYWDPLGISSFFTITKSIGILYFLFSLLNIRKYFTIKYVKIPIIVLLTIWLLLFLQSVFNYWPSSRVSIYNFTYLQNIALFWLVTNDLVRNSRLMPKLFIFLSAGVFLMAILVSLGIGLDSSIDRELGTYRLSFFGSNPNTIGNFASISLLLSIHMILNRKKYFGKFMWATVFAIPFFFNLLSLSGSRGSVLITVVGIILLFVLRKGNSIKKIFSIIISMGVISFLISKLMETEIMKQRIMNGIDEGGMGGRSYIWKAAIDIFLDYPFLGKGTTGYEYEIINRFGTYIDTHNLFLYFMVTIGFIGFCLYLYFVSLLIKSAFTYYRFQDDAILISLCTIYILLVSKSGGAINSKLLWLFTTIIYGVGKNLQLQIRMKKFN